MIVRVRKLHPDAVIPTYSKPGDAGMDLTAVEVERDATGNYCYNTGLSLEIPDGHVGLLFPRSSNTKKALTLGNSVGVIDSGYRGPIILKYRPLTFAHAHRPEEAYVVGDRVGQIIIIPYRNIHFLEVTELSASERGEGGFGSTGK